MSKDYLFEKQLKSFLRSLNEQEPPQLPPTTTGTAIPPALGQQTQQQGQQQGQQQAQQQGQQQGQQQAQQQQPAQDVPPAINIKYLSTPDLFTTEPPTDAADWTEEKKKPYYQPLKNGKVGTALVKHLKNSGFVATGRAGAARYSEYQFRMILRGDFYFDATIDAHVMPDDKVDVNFSKISTPTPFSNTPIEFTGGDDVIGGKDAENIDIKMNTSSILEWAKAKKVDKAENVGKEDEEGEEDTEQKGEGETDVDNLVNQFFENKNSQHGFLFEIELEKKPEEAMKSAEQALRKPFKAWFQKEIVKKNDPETVKYHMEDSEKRQAIKEAFAEWALTQGPAIDRKLLFKWLGKSIPMPSPGEEVGKIDLGKPTKKKKKEKSSAQKVASASEAKQFIKKQIDGESSPEVEKMAVGLYNEVARGLPPEHDLVTDVKNLKKIVDAAEQAVEDDLTVDDALPDLFKSFYQNETVDLQSYLRNLLLTEQAKGKDPASPKSPRKGEALERELGGRIIKAVNDQMFKKWFGRNKVAATTTARYFEGCLYEFLAVSAGTFKPRKRKVSEKRNDGSIVVQFDGEIVTQCEIWVDARVAENGNLGVWTFRVHDKPNEIFLKKGFGTTGYVSAALSRGTPKQEVNPPETQQGQQGAQ